MVAVLIGATANDIYQLAKEENSIKITTSIDENGNNNIRINDSYKIITPWVQYGYSLYLNHFNETTKNVIDGTSVGITYEWLLHNIGYYAFSILDLPEYKGSAQSVDVGKTIFSDNHGGFIEHGMKIAYLILDPIAAVHDLIIKGGYR